MKIKRIISLLLAVCLVATLAACGDKKDDAPADLNDTAETNELPQEDAEPADTTDGERVIKIGASPAPHIEILEAAVPTLAEKGITLEIVEFTDYVLPNLALADGSLDANYFQHEPYLLDFNEGNNTDLVAAGFIHYEPMGIYPGKTELIDDLPEGGTIAVPNDATNEARALLLLESLGIIKLREDAGIEATPIDIVENPKNIEIVEVEASQTPAALPDVDFSVINSNYALEAGVVDTVITVEDENSVAVEYANVIAVRAEDKDNPDIQTLVEVLKGEEVQAFITERYGSAVMVYHG